MNGIQLPLIFRLLHWGLAFAVFLNLIILADGNLVPHYNPKAVYAYYGIWACVATLAITGFMMGLDAFWGNDILSAGHQFAAYGLSALVVLHIGGVVADAILHKRRTWMVMVSGNKE
jgi:cytochrome b